MNARTIFKLVGAILVLTVVSSIVMLIPDWNGPQAAAEADDIDTLLDVTIVLSCLVFSLVVVMLGYAVIKFRAKPGDESDGKPVHGNTRLEIIWTAIPTVLVLFLAAYSWIVLDDIEAEADEGALPVKVIGQQFKWTFEYPEQGVVADEMHVPVGEQLKLELQALDVIHSFWVPEWRLKRDAVPFPEGNPTDVDNVMHVTPDREGSFQLVCTELCGLGHAVMRANVVVESQADFDQWVSEQDPIADQGSGSGGSGNESGS